MRRRGASRLALGALLGVNLILPAPPGPVAAPGFVEAYPVTAAAMRAAGPPYADWVAGGRRFLLFDRRGDGRVVEVLGDLAGADRIAVLVPGVGSTLADYDRGLGGVARRAPAAQAGQLYRQLRAADPAARVAVLAWLGYDPPDGVLTAAGGVRARQGAAGLAGLLRELAARRPAATITLVGHSYGALVVSLAATDAPVQVTDVVSLGGVGAGVRHADDLPPVTVLVAWAVPYLLGVAHGDGRLVGRRAAGTLALGGVAALAGLLALGYPVSAVGVPGAGVSNLNPPSLLVVVALAVSQVGVGLLARPALHRAVARPRVGRAVAGANRNAVRIYLWHQPVLVAVTALTARAGVALPGLHTAPDGPGWVLARCCWLPLLAVVLVTLVRVDRPADRRGAGRRPGGGGGTDRSAECVRSTPQVYDHRRSGRADLQEVIAVRDSDPPSRGRADGQPR
ncbi:alpha/beta hydrolase [Micromonospora sp. WMMD710]|uniref:alpha/beta hydrolase n=1 Tax=Micromonospora sp. WMMD710 TaxID=3016085 RepID=UPI0024175C46|nr:alpha/beta hydrolase [Micromonospora sp. WMMD710]MDG4757132.1 alpha/beta hydrolase [Micromonospora sp. WMMD710]